MAPEAFRNLTGAVVERLALAGTKSATTSSALARKLLLPLKSQPTLTQEPVTGRTVAFSDSAPALPERSERRTACSGHNSNAPTECALQQLARASRQSTTRIMAPRAGDDGTLPALKHARCRAPRSFPRRAGEGSEGCAMRSMRS